MHWFCILPHCWTAVWVLVIWGWRLLDFPYKVSCHLWRERIWLLLWQSECLLFLFVAWLLRLGLLVLCWTVVARVGILVKFLILRGKLSAFPHWEWYLLWAFVYGFYNIEVCSLCLYIVESCNQEKMLHFAKCFFCISWKDHIVLVLSFISVM